MILFNHVSKMVLVSDMAPRTYMYLISVLDFIICPTLVGIASLTLGMCGLQMSDTYAILFISTSNFCFQLWFYLNLLYHACVW